MARKKTKRIFVSATRKNDGKTVVSLGLCYAFRTRFNEIGFIKPVGQRYILDQGEKVDEDSVLIERTFGSECEIKNMSPVAIERGFTKNYIIHGNKKRLSKLIKQSFKTVAVDKDLVIIEGTGHAGVGSVFDLSNATVAKMLKSKVIIVSSGGIGRPIDEIILNKALYESEGVPIAGVIINKVMPEKYEYINKLVRKGLERKGLRVLGVIPYNRLLSEPSVQQLIDELDLSAICGKKKLDTRIGNIIVGAMSPHNALNYLSNKSLVITPGDREDLITAVLGYHVDHSKEGIEIAAIVLSGGIKPHKTVVAIAKRADVPMLLADDDTYTVASEIHDLTVKIRPEDLEKTRLVEDMITKYVDIDLITQYL